MAELNVDLIARLGAAIAANQSTERGHAIEIQRLLKVRSELVAALRKAANGEIEEADVEHLLRDDDDRRARRLREDSMRNFVKHLVSRTTLPTSHPEVSAAAVYDCLTKHFVGRSFRAKDVALKMELPSSSISVNRVASQLVRLLSSGKVEREDHGLYHLTNFQETLPNT